MKHCFTLFFFFSICISAFSQPGDGSRPFSFHHQLKNLKLETVQLAPPNIDSLKTADILEEAEGLPPRFGYAIPHTASLADFGKSFTSDQGTLYQYRISAPGAICIGLNFSAFHLPYGGKCWIYTPSSNKYLGAFTDKNFHPSGQFATRPEYGEEIILEYWEPHSVDFHASIILSAIVYGYKDPFEKAGFGGSGSCNVNINCDIAQGWENEKKATVMLLTSGNTRKCTGTMINNTAEDGTPYLLTAKHCNTLDNAIFMFNYESPDCNNLDGPVNMTLNGCSTVASNSYSDFTLLRLNQAPPPEYKIFYAGWNREDIPSPMSYCIHHPGGDIKKFSVDSQAVTTSGYLPNPEIGDAYWRVFDWDLGTTEGGSSGSPLFDVNHRIKGQLRGGLASCNNNLSDYYGKFFYSWDFGPDSSLRLQEWLDPLGTAQNSLDGGSYVVPFYDRDIHVLGLTGLPSQDCNPVQTMGIRFLSLSADTVTSITFRVEEGDSLYTFSWNGELTFLEEDTLFLQFPPFSLGQKNITAYVFEVNTLEDQQHLNDTAYASFKIINGDYYKIELKTDLFPEENTIFIFNDQLDTLFRFSNFLPGQLIEIPFCIEPGCYTFKILDSYGDGICCGTNGDGYYKLFSSSQVLIGTGSDFVVSDEIPFCNPFFGPKDGLFKMFPNPSQGIFTLQLHPDLLDVHTELSIIDYTGRISYQQILANSPEQLISTTGLSAGVYILRVFNPVNQKRWTEKILIFR